MPFTLKKRLLTSSSLSVCLSAFISTCPARRMSLKFDSKDFYESLSRKSRFG